MTHIELAIVILGRLLPLFVASLISAFVLIVGVVIAHFTRVQKNRVKQDQVYAYCIVIVILIMLIGLIGVMIW